MSLVNGYKAVIVDCEERCTSCDAPVTKGEQVRADDGNELICDSCISAYEADAESQATVDE